MGLVINLSQVPFLFDPYLPRKIERNCVHWSNDIDLDFQDKDLSSDDDFTDSFSYSSENSDDDFIDTMSCSSENSE